MHMTPSDDTRGADTRGDDTRGALLNASGCWLLCGLRSVRWRRNRRWQSRRTGRHAGERSVRPCAVRAVAVISLAAFTVADTVRGGRQRRQLEFQSDHWALDVVCFCVLLCAGVWVGMQRS